MAEVRNILFVMMDQLRWDYLSCAGHPYLRTPNIDRLAARGVRFDNAYVQSPVCGPSRASFYTGRTVFSHGSTWNRVPLPIGELTMGDYLEPAGLRTAVVGKTHMVADSEGMARLGLSPDTEIGMIVSEPGFENFERDDGVHPDGVLVGKPELAYNAWLRSLGYDGANPWQTHANSALGPDGEILSGWSMRNCHLPARVREEHSETAYMTGRAIEFISQMGDRPWLLHLSFIKPHWPYMAPAPYHDMYGRESFLPVHRDRQELQNPHPVYRAFTQMEVSKTFARDEVRENVLAPYMGLITQIDDHLGRLFAHLEALGTSDETLIVVTSDHGDYLGDHWMGEKELFHDVSVKVPLIIYDPRPEADPTRGTVCDAMVEAIDLLPTFMQSLGLDIPGHRLEGRSLQPFLHGDTPEDWRDHAFSEIDYSFYEACETLDVQLGQARGYMIRTHRWKYVYFKGFRPQLFDLENDPFEYHDLGDSCGHQTVRDQMLAKLVERLTDRRNRVTLADVNIAAMRPHRSTRGVDIGKW